MAKKQHKPRSSKHTRLPKSDDTHETQTHSSDNDTTPAENTANDTSIDTQKPLTFDTAIDLWYSNLALRDKKGPLTPHLTYDERLEHAQKVESPSLEYVWAAQAAAFEKLGPNPFAEALKKAAEERRKYAAICKKHFEELGGPSEKTEMPHYERDAQALEIIAQEPEKTYNILTS